MYYSFFGFAFSCAELHIIVKTKPAFSLSSTVLHGSWKSSQRRSLVSLQKLIRASESCLRLLFWRPARAFWKKTVCTEGFSSPTVALDAAVQSPIVGTAERTIRNQVAALTLSSSEWHFSGAKPSVWEFTTAHHKGSHPSSLALKGLLLQETTVVAKISNHSKNKKHLAQINQGLASSPPLFYSVPPLPRLVTLPWYPLSTFPFMQLVTMRDSWTKMDDGSGVHWDTQDKSIRETDHCH